MVKILYLLTTCSLAGAAQREYQ